MSANAPWSVKGIDARAREVAKDLARRSGMTLGEWLNQMILEGEDVGALISRESARAERPVYREAHIEPEAGGRMAQRSPRKPAAPYSSAASPLSSRDLRRKSIFDERAVYDDGYAAEEARYEAASSDLSRVARALESLGARMENSEARSATAVRGVSHAVESVLSRLERNEAAHAEVQGRVEEQSQDVLSSFERLSRAEEDHGLFAERLEQAERLIDAQAERLEGLSGHVRETRERAARIEQELASPQAQETVRAVEATLGKLANQLYEGEARTRDSITGVREDMVGLSHRLSQMELRDPDRAAQGLIDKVVAQLAHRLDAAEVQTTGAIRTLEQAFKTLEGRMNHVEEGGDVTDPETMKSLSGLAADLSRRVEESRQDLFSALQTGKQETIELAVKVVGERIEQSEKRSAGAIERMGQDVLRIADNLNRRMAGVEVANHDGISRVSRDVQRIADTVDGRFNRVESSHAQALERLGGEIARISERLTGKMAESERRAAEIVGVVGEQFERQRTDLSDRIRASEERTAKLLEETRARIDSRLAKVQTESLLAEAEAKPVPFPASHDDDEDGGLPSPFTASPFAGAPQAEPEPNAEVSEPAAGHEDEIDLTGRLLNLGAFDEPAFKPDFDPFEEDDLEADLVMNAPLTPPKAFDAPQAKAPLPALQEDDDSDPFADIEVSRKTAPRQPVHMESIPQQPMIHADTPAETSRSPFDDEDETDFDAAPVSVSTRDALAAARAAVRASIEGNDDRKERGLGLGLLKAGPSKAKGVKAEAAAAKAKGGSTFLNAVKASSIAMGVVAVGSAGWVITNKLANEQKAPTPIAASALTVSSPTAQDQQVLKTRYDLAVQALQARDPKAVDALKVVANQGYAPAQYKLGTLYKGDGSLVATDKAEARTWMKRAAEGGVPDAMNEYGYMFYNGEGGPQDRPTAALWFRKAAERGVVDGQYNLAQLYQSGKGVPLNPSEAYKWMKIAANNGADGAKAYAADLGSQLSDEQRARADDAVARFTPLSDGGPRIIAAGAESAG
jgi:localization factor PodJL